MGLATDILGSMRNGAADRAASDLFTKVVQAVQTTGKKGSVTIKFDIGKMKGGDTEIEIKASLSHKVPTEDIQVGIYYPDENGGLHRTDPRQLSFIDRGDNVIDASSRRIEQ